MIRTAPTREAWLRLAILLWAVTALSGCDGPAKNSSSGLKVGDQGSNQAQGNLTNDTVDRLCNDCPPPGYKGPPLG